jgi:ferrous iron transport protein A
MPDKTLPLTWLQTGESATLFNLGCGRSLIGRLTSLGFTPGVELTMSQNYRHGPLIVTVRGARVALGRGEAGQMLVQRRPA